MVGFFSRKAKNRAELLENKSRRLGEERKFKVVGKKTLSHEAYEHLIQNLLEDNELIKRITNKCGTEKNGTARCFLFYDKTNSHEALAVNSEGYDYARYTALIRTDKL